MHPRSSTAPDACAAARDRPHRTPRGALCHLAGPTQRDGDRLSDDQVDGLVVRYVLDVDGYRIDEADSMLRFEEYADAVRAAGYCEGAVVLEAPAGDPLVLEDAVPSLVTHLCFGAVGRWWTTRSPRCRSS